MSSRDQTPAADVLSWSTGHSSAAIVESFEPFEPDTSNMSENICAREDEGDELRPSSTLLAFHVPDVPALHRRW
jgi:hypothetical protein